MGKSFDMYTKEELAEISKKGRAASAAAKKHRKNLRDVSRLLFTNKIKQTNIIEQIKEAGYEGEFSAEEIMTLKLFQRALSNGESIVFPFKVIRFLAGESQKKKMNITKLYKR